MTQLMRTIKHQTLPLVRSDDDPKGLRDKPTILIRKIKHNKIGS